MTTIVNEANEPDNGKDENPEHIAAISPDGRPAHPEFRGAQIVVVAIVVGVIVLAVAILLGLTVSPEVGFGVGIAGIVLGIGTNTALWVSLMRAKERKNLDDDKLDDDS